MIKVFSTLNIKGFSKEQKDIYEMGLEVYRHYRYENTSNPKKKERLKQFATKTDKNGRITSLSEKEAIFTKSLREFAIRAANLPQDVTFNETALATHPLVGHATFAVIAEALDTLVPETVLDNFDQYAEIKTVGWGDQLVFRNPDNTDLFYVTTQSNSNRKTTRQRLLGNDLVMQPQNHAITVGEHWYRIITGQVNFAEYINRAVESMSAKISSMVYQAITDSFDTLGAQYKVEGQFNARDFNELRARVVAANGGTGRASAFGTQTALSQVYPEQAGFQMQLGAEYNANGFLGQFQGTNLFEWTQRLIPGTDDFAIDENTILVMASNNNKIVKIGFEGQTLNFNTPSAQSADLGQDYTLQQRFDVRLVNSGYYGVYKITE